MATEIIDKDMPYSALKRVQTKGTEFGKPTIVKAGKTYDVYDMIQAGRDDTEIYPTLEKYGCIDRMVMDVEAVYADLTNEKDLRSSLEQIEKANEMWLELPTDVRSQFHNDPKEFVENGEAFLKKQIDAINATKKSEVVAEKAVVEKGVENVEK